MKKRTARSDPRRRSLEDVMTMRFRAVFDSLDGLKNLWERSVREIQRTQAADLRVTRMVLREHNQRLKALEQRTK